MVIFFLKQYTNDFYCGYQQPYMIPAAGTNEFIHIIIVLSYLILNYKINSCWATGLHNIIMIYEENKPNHAIISYKLNYICTKWYLSNK